MDMEKYWPTQNWFGIINGSDIAPVIVIVLYFFCALWFSFGLYDVHVIIV